MSSPYPPWVRSGEVKLGRYETYENGLRWELDKELRPLVDALTAELKACGHVSPLRMGEATRRVLKPVAWDSDEKVVVFDRYDESDMDVALRFILTKIKFVDGRLVDVKP